MLMEALQRIAALGWIAFFFVYDVAWVRPFGIRHLITVDSLKVFVFCRVCT